MKMYRDDIDFITCRWCKHLRVPVLAHIDYSRVNASQKKIICIKRVKSPLPHLFTSINATASSVAFQWPGPSRFLQALDRQLGTHTS